MKIPKMFLQISRTPQMVSAKCMGILQGCALRVLGCLRRLTLALGDQIILFLSYKLYAGHPGSHSLEPLGFL